MLETQGKEGGIFVKQAEVENEVSQEGMKKRTVQAEVTLVQAKVMESKLEEKKVKEEPLVDTIQQPQGHKEEIITQRGEKDEKVVTNSEELLARQEEELANVKQVGGCLKGETNIKEEEDVLATQGKEEVKFVKQAEVEVTVVQPKVMKEAKLEEKVKQVQEEPGTEVLVSQEVEKESHADNPMASKFSLEAFWRMVETGQIDKEASEHAEKVLEPDVSKISFSHDPHKPANFRHQGQRLTLGHLKTNKARSHGRWTLWTRDRLMSVLEATFAHPSQGIYWSELSPNVLFDKVDWVASYPLDPPSRSLMIKPQEDQWLTWA